MRTKTFIKILVFFAIAAITIACNNKQKQNSDPKDLTIVVENNSDDGQLDFFRFPSPDEILGFIEVAHLEFQPDIINSPYNVNKYNTHTAQTINLGVYATDLAYICIFKKQDAMVKHLGAISQLTQMLKIEAAFPKGFIEKLSVNINNIDSLVNISEQSFQHVSTYLEGSGNEKTLALLTLGTYVESLHLLLKSIDNYEKNPEIIQILSNQKFAFENLNDFIKQNISSDLYEEHFKIIGEVNKIFNQMDKIKVQTSTDNSENDVLVIGSEYKYVLSEKGFNELKSLIKEKRKEIVNDSKK